MSKDKINEILTEEKIQPKTEKISINYTRLKEYFPEDYSQKQCEEALWEILEKWFKKNK